MVNVSWKRIILGGAEADTLMFCTFEVPENVFAVVYVTLWRIDKVLGKEIGDGSKIRTSWDSEPLEASY